MAGGIMIIIYDQYDKKFATRQTDGEDDLCHIFPLDVIARAEAVIEIKDDTYVFRKDRHKEDIGEIPIEYLKDDIHSRLASRARALDGITE